MKKALIALLLFTLSFGARAQFTPGQVLTAQQLNNQFALYLPIAGGTLTGPLTVPSITVTGGGSPITGTTGTGAAVLQLGATIVSPILNGIVSGTAQFATTGSATFAGGITGTPISYTQPGTGAVVQTVNTKLAQSVNVLDFGAACNGTTDDSAKFTAAGASLSATGGAIHVPFGTCLAPSFVLPTGVSLIGLGPGASTILTNSPTANMITVSGGNGGVTEIAHLQLASSVTRTAGAFVFSLTSVLVEDVAAQGYFVGFNFSGASGSSLNVNSVLDNVNMFLPAVGVGSAAAIFENYGNAVVHHLVAAGPSTGQQPDNGLVFKNGDTAFVSDTNVTHHGYALAIVPGANENNFSFNAANDDFDSAGLISGAVDADSCFIAPTGNGNVYESHFSNVWCGLSLSSGALVGSLGTGVIQGMHWSDGIFDGNTNSGFQIGANVSSWSVTGGVAAGNGASGYFIGSASTDWSLLGVRAGPIGDRGSNGSFGVNIGANASNNYTVIADTNGNSGGTLFNGGTGATQLVINNSAGVTQGRLDNSASLATDAFVNQQNASSGATVPFAAVTGGTYNQATLGSGAQIVVFASGGVVTSSLTIVNPGSGYAVGDLLALPAGNSDAVLRVTGVSGGGVTSVGVAYGGSGYTTGLQVTAMPVPPGRRTVVFTGALTSNLTFIIQSGTNLTASREVEFINNTTGAFTVKVLLSNGSGGTTGSGVTLPQGTNSSTALAVYTDGVNDVWIANTPAGIGALTAATATATFAPIASPTFTGTPLAPTPAANTNSTQLATTAFVRNYLAAPIVGFGTTTAVPSGAFVNLSATGTATAPTQSVGVSNTTIATTNYVTSEISSGAQPGAFTTLSASGNDALFYQNTSAQSIPSATATTLTGWTLVSDRVGTNFVPSTGVFTAPVTGFYEVSGQINFASAAEVGGTTYQLAAVANGTTVALGSSVGQAAGTYNVEVQLPSVTVALTAGQTFVFQAVQNSGAARSLGALGTQTFISINRIP